MVDRYVKISCKNKIVKAVTMFDSETVRAFKMI